MSCPHVLYKLTEIFVHDEIVKPDSTVIDRLCGEIG